MKFRYSTAVTALVLGLSTIAAVAIISLVVALVTGFFALAQAQQTVPPPVHLNPCTGLPATAPYYDDIDLGKPWPVCVNPTLPQADVTNKGLAVWRWCKSPTGKFTPQWAVLPWSDLSVQPLLALELSAAGLNMNEDALKAVTAKYAALIKPLAHADNAAIWCPLWSKIAATKPSDAPPPTAFEWIVAKNGTSPTRPTYYVTGGRRAYVSNGTVPVGVGCDTARVVLEGPLTFGYPVGAKPDSVALCVRR